MQLVEVCLFVAIRRIHPFDLYVPSFLCEQYSLTFNVWNMQQAAEIHLDLVTYLFHLSNGNLFVFVPSYSICTYTNPNNSSKQCNLPNQKTE